MLLTPDVRASLPVAFLHQLQLAFAQSLFWIFLLMFIFAIIGVTTMFLLPGGRADKYSYKSQQAATDSTNEESPEVVAAPSMIDSLS